ncbi:UNVERIFIED_CONTAM: hypothetical protein Sangu_3063200 [Sesamum angustifolium]|uniref:Uncharacterized protein n=1 Tax=Sesamum angustifolium TaxID=2727405 RepID=A0AAW2KG88_9LAMI
MITVVAPPPERGCGLAHSRARGCGPSDPPPAISADAPPAHPPPKPASVPSSILQIPPQ